MPRGARNWTWAVCHTNTHVGSELDISSMVGEIFSEFPDIESLKIIAEGMLENGEHVCVDE